jgi:hypothetical protein
MTDSVQQQDWGTEVTWANHDNYCGKILIFEKANSRTPLHFHINTAKSWFVNAGSFRVTWVDTAEGKSYAKELPEGSTFDVPALMPVMLESLQANSVMAQVSNGSNPQDYYRLNDA